MENDSAKFKIGYMPSFAADIFEEIKFAKDFFDFTEITLERNLEKYNTETIAELKNGLQTFPVMGHIHWEADLLNPDEILYIEKVIKIHEAIGTKKITIHPSSNAGMNEIQIIEQNCQTLKQISQYCNERDISLLVENSTIKPFNNTKTFKYLFSEINTLKMTLDIGHANISTTNGYQTFIDTFKTKILHVHLHSNDGLDDHLPFLDRNQMNPILTSLLGLEIKPTITLEIFREKNNQKILPLDTVKRKKILIKQVQMIKSSGF